MAETDERLLARWRGTLTTLRGFDGQPLDSVDRQTQKELRQQLERVEAELDRRGLRQTEASRSGNWQPLPLHQHEAPGVDPSWEPAPRDEPTGEQSDELVTMDEFRSLFEFGPDSELEFHRIVTAALLREWIEEEKRELPSFADSKPLTHRRGAPYAPELRDGLTPAQRLLFERLGHGPCSEEQLLSNPPNDDGPSLTRALEELRLSRRYPLVFEHDGLVELTPLAKEMIAVEPGRVWVHGGFFPNLLSNGVADGLVFPTLRVEKVIAAAELVLEYPNTPDQNILRAAGSFSVGGGWTVHRTSQRLGLAPGGAICLMVVPRQWTRTMRLEFHFATAADAIRAAERLHLAQARHEFAEGTLHEVFDGTKLGVTLPPGTHGTAVVRRLLMDRALESWWQVDTNAIDADGARQRTVREMVEAFALRSREEVERKLRLQTLPADGRLEAIEGLLRVARDERLAALVDAAESKDQARWALTHLGSLELTAHPRLGVHAVAAEPFSQRQASAIVDTTGLHRKLHLLELERDALIEERDARVSPFRPSEVARLLQLELRRVAATAAASQSAQWSSGIKG